MNRKYVIGILILLSSLFSPEAYAATPPEIVISEINWAGGTESKADEWIELYNGTSESVDLGGWILTGSAPSGDALALAEGTTIAGKDTLLVSNYPLEHEKTTLGIEADLTTATLSLPNNKLEVMLVMPDGTVVDEVAMSGAPDAGSNDPYASMEKNLTTGEWETATTSVNLLDETQLGTPGVVIAPQEVLSDDEVLAEPIVDLETGETVKPDESPEELTVDPEPAPESEQEILDSEEPLDGEVTEETETVDEVEVVDETEVTDETEVVDEIETTVEEVATEELETIEDVTEESSVEETIEEVDENPIPNPNQSSNSTPSSSSTQTTTSTPVSEPEVTLTSYDAGTIIFSEIVSDPEFGGEWIELFIPGDDSIETTAWTITDASGKETLLTFDEVAGGSYLVIENPNGILNNDGDTLELFDAAGNLIDSLEYGGDNEAPKKGESLALETDGTWQVTSNITKEQLNQFEYENIENEEETESTIQLETVIHVDELPEQESTNLASTAQSEVAQQDPVVSDEPETHRVVAIAEDVKTKTNTKTNSKASSKTKSNANSGQISRSGVITALPGTFGKQVAFIDSVQLYFYKAEWPDLQVGDMVVVSGTPSNNQGEDRLKIASANDIKITGHTDLQATPLTIPEVLLASEGTLVSVTGRILERNGNKLVIKSDGTELTVVANDRTGMSWSGLGSDTITVTGVVRYTSGHAKLYPRTMTDVFTESEVVVEKTKTAPLLPAGTINSSNNGPTSKNKTPWLGIGFLTFGITSLFYWLMKARTLQLQTQTT